MATVLVVEDEILVSDVTAEDLVAAGFDVVIASHADQVIAILEARKNIHLVFTDIAGSMDGLKLAAAVRDRWPPIHIIITTGKPRPAEIPSKFPVHPEAVPGQNDRVRDEDFREHALRGNTMSVFPLMERSIEIAWDYLGRSGQISDPEFTSKFLLTLVEHNVRMGERRQLTLVNRATSDFERSKLSQVE